MPSFGVAANPNRHHDVGHPSRFQHDPGFPFHKGADDGGGLFVLRRATPSLFAHDAPCVNDSQAPHLKLRAVTIALVTVGRLAD
jgi:hypothetical protein